MRVELEELRAVATVVRLPLRVRFRGVSEREALLLRGPAGWAEFSPFLEYRDEEAARWLAAAVQTGWDGLPTPVRHHVEVNATIPAVPPAQVPAVLAAFPGCRTVKVKVAEPGQDPAADLARVAAVRAAAGAQARIRVDANGGWDVRTAYRTLSELSGYGLQYAEQPCRTVPELAELAALLDRAGTGVPLAADESIRKASDPLAVARTGAVRFAVVKVAPLGGPRRLLAIADRLRALDVQVVVSSALDTSVGIAAGVAAAAALPGRPPASGLGTTSLLAADIAAPGLDVAEGRLPVRRVEADPGLLDRYQAPPQRRAWWLARLARCHRLLDTLED